MLSKKRLPYLATVSKKYALLRHGWIGSLALTPSRPRIMLEVVVPTPMPFERKIVIVTICSMKKLLYVALSVFNAIFS